jgi:hypothetical protein
MTFTEHINQLIADAPKQTFFQIEQSFPVEELLPGCTVDLKPLNLPFDQWTDEETAANLTTLVEMEYCMIEEIHIHGLQHPLTGEIHELREFCFTNIPITFTIPPDTGVFVARYENWELELTNPPTDKETN